MNSQKRKHQTLKACHFLNVFMMPLLISGCSNNYKSHIFKPGFEASLPVMEAIQYPTYRETNSDKPYTIKIYLANLYYGKKYGSNEIVFLRSYSGLLSITILLELKDEVLMFYDVDLLEYEKQENGICSNTANKAKITDFNLYYSFNLQEIFNDNYDNQNIEFKIVYKEEIATKTSERGKAISFLLNKNESGIKIDNFDYYYFN